MQTSGGRPLQHKRYGAKTTSDVYINTSKSLQEQPSLNVLPEDRMSFQAWSRKTSASFFSQTIITNGHGSLWNWKSRKYSRLHINSLFVVKLLLVSGLDWKYEYIQM